MSIEYTLICDKCGFLIDGSKVSASEVRRIAMREKIGARIGGRDLCAACIEEMEKPSDDVRSWYFQGEKNDQ